MPKKTDQEMAARIASMIVKAAGSLVWDYDLKEVRAKDLRVGDLIVMPSTYDSKPIFGKDGSPMVAKITNWAPWANEMWVKHVDRNQRPSQRHVTPDTKMVRIIRTRKPDYS